jgi:cytochrome d ubiquinol oxidase subunit I
MNAPAGFDFDPVTRTFSNIDPIAAMFNRAWAAQVAHMLVAAYMATGFAVAGVHALVWLRKGPSTFHREALRMAMLLAAPAAIVQPLVGHWAAQVVAHNQPVKLAAMEGQFETESGAPLRIGGIPDVEARTTRYAVEIPYMLSVLAYNDPKATVRGLNEFPREDWPPVGITHYSFQLMVAFGTVMLIVAAWWAVETFFRRREALPRSLLAMIVVCAPLGFLAIEFGWFVTEVGRQPWIIQGIMRTREALTPMPGLATPFITICVVYAGLTTVVVYLLTHMVRATQPDAESEQGAEHG